MINIKKIQRICTPQNLLCFISYLLIAILGLLFINTCRYCFYSADDFAHGNTLGVFDENIFGLFFASIRFMIYRWKTWQGTYFSMFLQGFLSPVNGLGETQLVIVMIFNIIIFIASVLLFVNKLCSIIAMKNHLKSFLSLLVLVSILSFKSWPEIFYWYSGAVSYSFPLSIAILGIVLYLINKNMTTYVFSCVLSFLASGGSLEVAGANCFAILTILFLKGVKACKKKDYIFFGISLLGSAINTIAPGNYMRHDVIDSSGLHIHVAAINSIQRTVLSLESLLFKTPFLIVLFLCVVMGYNINGGKWFHKSLFYKAIAMCILMPIITAFPVYLGYSSPSLELPNRCDFVHTFIIIMAAIIVCVLLGVFFKETTYIDLKPKELLVALLFLCLIMPTLNENYRYSTTVIYRMFQNTVAGQFEKYHDSVVDIYKTIEESENPDVIIESLPEAVPDFHTINTTITTDPTNWANQSVAKYYEKNSVLLKPLE